MVANFCRVSYHFTHYWCAIPRFFAVTLPDDFARLESHSQMEPNGVCRYRRSQEQMQILPESEAYAWL